MIGIENEIYTRSNSDVIVKNNSATCFDAVTNLEFIGSYHHDISKAYKKFRRGGVILISLAVAGAAHAASIPNLFVTGVDSSGAALNGGANDPHYSILSPTGPGIVINQSSIPGTWIPYTTVPPSRWIWQTATGQPTNVTRTFRTTFDLTGLDPLTASISGQWAVDNFGDDILINGISTGQTNNSGFGSFSPFTISSGFTAGLNTLDFVVRDIGVTSGFRVGSISGTAQPIPEPLTILGAGTAVGFGAFFKRKLK